MDTHVYPNYINILPLRGVAFIRFVPNGAARMSACPALEPEGLEDP